MEFGIFYDHIKKASRAFPDPLPSAERLCFGLRERGISGVTVNVDGFTDDDLAAVKKASLRIDTAYCVCRLVQGVPLETERIERAAAVGAGFFMLVPGFYEDGVNDFETALKNAVPLISEAKKICDSLGLVCCMENYGGRFTPYSRASELLMISDACGGLPLVFDTGNFLYFGLDPAREWELVRDRVVHVHGKDLLAAPGSGSHFSLSPTGRVLCPTSLGRGEARDFLAALFAADPPLSVTIEHDNIASLFAFTDDSLAFARGAKNSKVL